MSPQSGTQQGEHTPPRDILARIDEWMASVNGRKFDCVRSSYYTPQRAACAGCVIKEARSEIHGLRRMLEASHLANCPDKVRGIGAGACVCRVRSQRQLDALAEAAS